MEIRRIYPGGGGSPVAGLTVNTGALVAGVQKSVTHNLGLTTYTLFIQGDNTQLLVKELRPDPADPTNKLLITTNRDHSAPGLPIILIGF